MWLELINFNFEVCFFKKLIEREILVFIKYSLYVKYVIYIIIMYYYLLCKLYMKLFLK